MYPEYTYVKKDAKTKSLQGRFAIYWLQDSSTLHITKCFLENMLSVSSHEFNQHILLFCIGINMVAMRLYIQSLLSLFFWFFSQKALNALLTIPSALLFLLYMDAQIVHSLLVKLRTDRRKTF